jgi:excisionase family DNA binding protein
MEEAARLLAVTRPTLYRWADAGLITFVKVGGRTFVTDSELDRFVARAEVAASSEGRSA